MVLTEPGLSVVVDAMLIARGVFQRMLSFLTYRVAATLQLVFFFFIGVFALPLENYGIIDDKFKFFQLPVLMFMLITLLNDGTLMCIGYDNVVPSVRPQRWNLPVLFCISAVLAAVACASSLLLLWMAADSIGNYDQSWFHGLGITKVRPGQIVSMIYLKVSISDFLTLFSARTQDKFFWSNMPSAVLLCGALISLAISTIVAIFWPDTSPDDINTMGLVRGDGNTNLLPIWVWLYCIFWWFVQDVIKVLAYKLLERFDIFHYRTIALGHYKPKAKKGKTHHHHPDDGPEPFVASPIAVTSSPQHHPH
ncbi:P-type H+-ATPase, putative [Bodo saltans]|uniref:P-type H+-ATPase, putative n=1 Tax=Bodo saltans TaxID=75058 RepID=A0A0S4IJY1_BODSA|nr:P-type H+-ATPase, putative [Bodo saltans]|eukprot:CUE96343.1 P-type H+-ATPase, putative [Bodo saltans]